MCMSNRTAFGSSAGARCMNGFKTSGLVIWALLAFGVVTAPIAASAAPPTAGTGAATNITATTATLNGTANPNGLATIGFFLYGPTTSYGSATPDQMLGSGNAIVAIGGGNVTG